MGVPGFSKWSFSDMAKIANLKRNKNGKKRKGKSCVTDRFGSTTEEDH
jgi:hypothetical protein